MVHWRTRLLAPTNPLRHDPHWLGSVQSLRYPRARGVGLGVQERWELAGRNLRGKHPLAFLNANSSTQITAGVQQFFLPVGRLLWHHRCVGVLSRLNQRLRRFLNSFDTRYPYKTLPRNSAFSHAQISARRTSLSATTSATTTNPCPGLFCWRRTRRPNSASLFTSLLTALRSRPRFP